MKTNKRVSERHATEFKMATHNFNGKTMEVAQGKSGKKQEYPNSFKYEVVKAVSAGGNKAEVFKQACLAYGLVPTSSMLKWPDSVYDSIKKWTQINPNPEKTAKK